MERSSSVTKPTAITSKWPVKPNVAPAQLMSGRMVAVPISGPMVAHPRARPFLVGNQLFSVVSRMTMIALEEETRSSTDTKNMAWVVTRAHRNMPAAATVIATIAVMRAPLRRANWV